MTRKNTDDLDRLHHLADALSDDIQKTPSEALLAESAEDHGRRGTLALEFDHLFNRAVEDARRPSLAGAWWQTVTWYAAKTVRPLRPLVSGLAKRAGITVGRRGARLPFFWMGGG